MVVVFDATSRHSQGLAECEAKLSLLLLLRLLRHAALTPLEGASRVHMPIYGARRPMNAYGGAFRVGAFQEGWARIASLTNSYATVKVGFGAAVALLNRMQMRLTIADLNDHSITQVRVANKLLPVEGRRGV